MTVQTDLSLRKRVLLDARFSANSLGGDRCRMELAHNVSRFDQNDYTFLVYEDVNSGLINKQTITTKSRPNQHPAADLFEHLWLPLKARQIGADIYHGTFNVLPLIRAAKLNIVTIHDMAVFAFPEAYSKRFVQYMRWLILQSAANADGIIVVSEATKQELLRFIPSIKVPIYVVLNGVGKNFLDVFSASADSVLGVKQKYGINKPYVLYVGNLERKKNLPNLLKAFSEMRKRYPIAHELVIAGKPLDSGPDAGFGNLVKATREIVKFTGFVDEADLPYLYRGADLIAYPSLYEGFGMPVLEGMAAGVPVLTSSVSSLPEVAGGAAWLVDPLNIEEMANSLQDALTNESRRETAIHDGRARAQSLSWRANARNIEDIYDELWLRHAGKH